MKICIVSVIVQKKLSVDYGNDSNWIGMIVPVWNMLILSLMIVWKIGEHDGMIVINDSVWECYEEDTYWCY